MGLFSSILGAAAPIVGGLVGGPAGAAIGGALGGALSSKGAPSSTTTSQNSTTNSTSQQNVDPRIANLLFGSGDQQGLLNNIQNQFNAPAQSTGSAFLGELGNNYLLGSSGEELNRLRNANYDLLQGNRAPTIGAAQFDAAQINAPSQNALNLSPAYQNFIYGNAAENPYLTKSLQSGINQSNQAFQTQLGDITNNLQRNILPGIRGNAIASGQFGSSRQGIAEGLAASDLNRQATNAAQQLGLANISATTGAQANAFNQGQDRSLSALQNLSGQQYNTALTQAQLNQQAAAANAAARQAADVTNVNAGLQTQAQNQAGNIAGQQGLSNLLNFANQASNVSNNANINRLGQLGGLVSPFLGVNSTVTNNGTTTGAATQPLYQNTAGNILGGALTGVSLLNQFGGLGRQAAGQTTATNSNPWAFV